jgi:hypothetical protein
MNQSSVVTLKTVLKAGYLRNWKILLVVSSLAWIRFSLATTVQDSRSDPPQKASDSGTGMMIPPDYFPLNPGNRWIYSKTESRFKKTETVRIEIISTPIIKWKTYYVFNQLPFVPGLESGNNILVRYDNVTKRYLRLTQEGETPLFPVSPEADAQFDASVDASNNPVANRMSYLTCLRCSDAGMEVVFDRGIGVVAVQSTFVWGTENYELKSALVNWQNFGEPMVDEKASAKEPKTGPVVSRADPNLSLEVEKVDQGAKLIFVVKNPTESFLSFRFTSSQTYDFVVREKESGFEIWRWSKGNFFSQVLRNLALLPQKEWRFEEVWNYKDSERNDVKQGVYEAVAILTTKQPLESAPVEIVIP